MKNSILLTSSIFLLTSMSASAGIVSDPFRAAGVTWPKHECKGRTWRYLLEPSAQELDAFKNEAFAQDAGYNNIYCPSKLENRRGDYQFGFKAEGDRHRFVVQPPSVDAATRKRMHDVPFVAFENTRWIFDLKREECDLHVWDDLIREYPDTFLGVNFIEWDAGVLWPLPNRKSGGYRKIVEHLPPNYTRDDMAQFFCDFYDSNALYRGPRAVSFSGPCNLVHFGVERGSALAYVELTLEQSWRSLMMHTRGAGRQYGVPLTYYLAYYLAANRPDSRRPCDTAGEDWGIPPSLAYRTILLGYYQGCNYQTFESFPWGFVKEVERVEKVEGVEKKAKTTVLTENGKVLKRAYEFIRSPEGVRGTFYAPILLLADWAHGHDNLRQPISLAQAQGPFTNHFPPTVFDQYYQDVLDVLSPYVPPYNKASKHNAKHQYQLCLVNSSVGDIFDVYIANPRTKGRELRADQLAKYSVVMSLGGIRWTDELRKLVADYVAGGGTFVNVEGEADPAIKEKIGHGNVLTAPRDRAKLAAFIRDLQREVLPVEVETTCELVWNVMPDGSWRVCAANNKGVEKPLDSGVQTFHAECAEPIRFVLPKGGKVKVREVVAKEPGAKSGTEWTVPPGEVRVFEIRGLDAQAKKFVPLKATTVVPPPDEFPLDFKYDEVCKYDVASFKADYDTDEVTVECWAKPLPAEEWKAQKHGSMDGGPFVVGAAANNASRNFGPTWKDGHWCLKRGPWNGEQMLKGPKADPTRFTKLAATLKDGVLHFFVDDKEVFSETGPILHPEGTPKCRFYNTFTFWRGTSAGGKGYRFLGEVKDCHAYSKAIYPIKYEVKVKGEDATTAIQKTIDAAVEKTGEVVLKKGTYKVSQLQLRTGVTLHLEEGASIVRLQPSPSPLLIAAGITDFTILGPGTIAGEVLFENVQRATVRRLKMADGKLVVKGSKNVVVEKCEGVEIDAKDSTRILVDGKLFN